MLDSLLRWIDNRGGAVWIRDNNYLKRHFIVSSKHFGVLLHEWHGSDPDRPHCHPWWSVSIPLRGYLLEHFHDDTVRHLEFGRIAIRTSRELHRIVVPKQRTRPVTLFIHGPVRRKWGFIAPASEWRDRFWVSATSLGIENSRRQLRGWFFPRISSE